MTPNDNDSAAFANRKALAELLRQHALHYYECAEGLENATTLKEFKDAVDLLNGRNIRYRIDADRLCAMRLDEPGEGLPT